MRRILVLMTVGALMAVMRAMSVAPALAAPKGYICTLPDGTQAKYSFGQFKHEASTGGEFPFPEGTLCTSRGL